MERITDRPVLISFTAHEIAKTAMKIATSWSVVRVETKAVSYTHLPETSGASTSDNQEWECQEIFLEDGIPYSMDEQGNRIQLGDALQSPVSYTHLDVYKRKTLSSSAIDTGGSAWYLC